MRRRFYVAMDITNRCNLRCTMCARSALPADAPQHMTPEQFRTIGDHLFRGATVVALSCGAEPLMARHFGEILWVCVEDVHVSAILAIMSGGRFFWLRINPPLG